MQGGPVGESVRYHIRYREMIGESQLSAMRRYFADKRQSTETVKVKRGLANYGRKKFEYRIMAPNQDPSAIDSHMQNI
uniref:Uncharacterized protein n=1 Tax=Romanomermis culicivorax TaxID=13658 RepID=A0A915JIU8_ROMCU